MTIGAGMQRGERGYSHQLFTDSFKTIAMAQTFVDLGYDVDVIHAENQDFVPWKSYDVMVDTRFNLQRLQPFLPVVCIKILHCDTAQLVFQNQAEMGRMLALQNRKGVTVLRPIRDSSFGSRTRRLPHNLRQ